MNTKQWRKMWEYTLERSNSPLLSESFLCFCIKDFQNSVADEHSPRDIIGRMFRLAVGNESMGWVLKEHDRNNAWWGIGHEEMEKRRTFAAFMHSLTWPEFLKLTE